MPNVTDADRLAAKSICVDLKACPAESRERLLELAELLLERRLAAHREAAMRLERKHIVRRISARVLTYDIDGPERIALPTLARELESET